MDSRDWKILKTIYREKSISQAANMLYVSQPSITYRIKKLEEEFGVDILIRNSNGVSFTTEGKQILKFAQEMDEKLNALKEYINNISISVNGSVCVGISTVFSKYKLAPILKDFYSIFPEVKLHIKTGSSTVELPSMIRNNEVDIAIIRGGFSWDGYIKTISEEPFGIISSDHININDLSNTLWIKYEKPGTPDSDDIFYKWWDSKFSKPYPKNILTVNSIEASIKLAEQGLGWTVIPKIHITNNKALYFQPLLWPNKTQIVRKTSMLFNRHIIENSAAKAFINCVVGNTIDI